MHVADLIAELSPPPPPIFADPSAADLWPELGWSTGADAWQALVDGTAEAGAQDTCDDCGGGTCDSTCDTCDGRGWLWRAEPVITYEGWDQVLRAERLRRARYVRPLIHGDDSDLLAADMRLCRLDPLHWLDHWAVVQDPHFRDAALLDLPLVTFPDQRALFVLVDRLLDGDEERSLITNKGRGRGWTWTLLNLAVKHLLFRQGFMAEVLSRKLEDVDRGAGDTKALLGKARYILERQPYHLAPSVEEGEEERGEAGTRSIHTLIANLATGGRLSGSATTGDASRGDRLRLRVFDEFARIDPRIQEQVRSAAETVAHVDLAGSTPSGRGTRFHYEWENGRDGDKTLMPWYGDPRRGRQWWEARLIANGGKLTASEREREHGCKFIGIESVTIWSAGEEVDYLDEDLPDDWRRRSSHLAAMDFGTGPSATTYLHALPEWELIDRDGRPEYRLVHLWLDWSEEWHRTIETEIARDVLDVWGRDYGNGSWAVYGDSAGWATGAGQKSVGLLLQEAGLPLRPAPAHYMSAEHKDHVIRVAQEWLDDGTLRLHETRALYVRRALDAWEWEVPRGLRIAEVSREHHKPRKDDHSHHGDALLILVSAVLDGAGKPAVKSARGRVARRSSALGRL